MSAEERVKFLLRAARRVEAEGDSRVADLFRRMAREAVQGRLPVPAWAGSRSDG